MHFYHLLYEHLAMIIYRMHFENTGLTDEWWRHYSALSETQLAIIKPIIESNDFSDYESHVTDPEILKVLSYYRIKREDAEKEMGQS